MHTSHRGRCARNGGFSDEAIHDAHREATIRNLSSPLARRVLDLFVCLSCGQKLRLSDGILKYPQGHSVPVLNGIPDFTSYMQGNVAYKAEQAGLLDSEHLHTFVSRNAFQQDHTAKARSLQYSLRIMARTVQQALGIDLGEALVLNCGCGKGLEATYLAALGTQIAGLDIFLASLHVAATRFTISELPGFFFCCDACRLPFAQGAFDLVLYHQSLHHLPLEEMEGAIREAARVSRKGVVLLELHESPLTLAHEIISRSRRVEKEGNYAFRFKRSLVRFWAERCGLRLAAYRPIFSWHGHGRQRKNPLLTSVLYSLTRVLGPILRPLGNEACAVLAKPTPQNH